jgi:hypothetical protein
MEKSANILFWGFGNMGKILVKYAVERKLPIVGVIGHHNVGEDAGEVAGVGAINIKV